MKILIAEDDKFLAKAYKMKLVKQGHEVQVEGDGKLALAAAAEFKPDVILLDLIMPNMDGFTFLETIKADEELKGIPVIVASNLGQEEDLKKAKSLGAADYIIKSNMSLEDLIEKVESLA